VTRTAAVDAALGTFTAALTEWGARMNLVGSTDPAAIARHIADSLAAAEHLPEACSVVDLGSGAGFPGIPIALARPDLRMTLVEIREKRLAFLRHAVRELGLAIEVRAASIESTPADPFDFALLRAVAKPARSLELGLRWLAPAGEAWIWVGPEASLEPSNSIPLASGGKILRLRAADFSRGTD
jgi:16S rRNA (guanine527-N7)-methyltransferase